MCAASAVAAPPEARDGDGASDTDIIDCVGVGGGISGLVTAQVRLSSGHRMLAPYSAAAPSDAVDLHSRCTAGDSKSASACGPFTLLVYPMVARPEQTAAHGRMCAHAVSLRTHIRITDTDTDIIGHRFRLLRRFVGAL